MPVEGVPIWKTERACCLLPCALVAVCEVDWYKRGYLACRLQRPQSQNQMRVSIAVNGRNSALSISDYSSHTSRMPCPRQGLPRSRNVHACCLLSSVRDGHYSVLQNKIRVCTWGQRVRTTDRFAVCVVRVPPYGELQDTDNSACTSNRAAV